MDGFKINTAGESTRLTDGCGMMKSEESSLSARMLIWVTGYLVMPLIV